MKNLKWTLSAVAVCCILFLLWALAPRGDYQILHIDASTQPEEQVTLRLICPWAGTDTRADTLRRLLEQYGEEHPQVEIVNESMSGEDFLMKLKTDFASGNEPDVFALWPGSNLRSLIDAGKVADLTALLDQEEEWKKSFEKNCWYYVTVNDRIYGVPLEQMYQCMFVNTDMFESYGVEIPRDFEGLKAAVTEFREKGVTPIAWHMQSEGSYLYQSVIASLGGRIDTEMPFVGGQVQDCYIRAADYLKELYDLGAFPSNLFQISEQECNELFFNKQAAMIVQRSPFIGEVNRMQSAIDREAYAISGGQDVKLTVDMIPFPAIEGGKGDPTALIYGLGSGTFFISQAAWDDLPRRQASIDLLKFLTSEPSATAFAENNHMLSAVKITPPNVYYSGLMKRGRLLIGDTKEVIQPPDSLIDKSVWDGIIVEQLPYVLEGHRTSREVWDEVVEWYRSELGAAEVR